MTTGNSEIHIKEKPRRGHPFWRSLSFRITVTIAVVMMLSLGGALWYALRVETELEYRQVEVYTQKVAELALQSFDTEFKTHTPFHTTHLASKILELPNLHNLRVLAIDHTIQFSRYIEEIGTKMDYNSAPGCNRCHVGGSVLSDERTYFSETGARLYHLPFPIPNMPQCTRCHRPEFKILGTMVVEMEIEPMMQKLIKHRSAMALSVLIALSTSILGTALIFRKFVRRPLNHLQEDMRKVQAGDFTLVGPPPDTKDEIQEVYLAFMTMTRRLEEVQNHLNALVLEKSAIVDDLNQELRKIYSNLINMEHLSALGTLSSQVVHEIRTPLNVLNLNLQLLHKELLKHSDLETDALESAANIGREVERISSILEKFMDRARRPLSAPTKESLRNLVMGVVALMGAEAQKASVRIDVGVLAGLERVLVQADEMRQILINLIGNGISAMPKGGTLSIDASQMGGKYELTITDAGVGISEENLERIFTPFFTTRANGTGLGLPIVKRLVEDMGGEIRVRSVLGSGSTFSIVLPLKME